MVLQCVLLDEESIRPVSVKVIQSTPWYPSPMNVDSALCETALVTNICPLCPQPTVYILYSTRRELRLSLSLRRGPYVPTGTEEPTLRDGGYYSAVDGLIVRDMAIENAGGECIRLRCEWYPPHFRGIQNALLTSQVALHC